MNCKNCGHSVFFDGDDLIHTLFENIGVDARLCTPSDPYSKIAEV